MDREAMHAGREIATALFESLAMTDKVREGEEGIGQNETD
jgi:hypothetical protein